MAGNGGNVTELLQFAAKWGSIASLVGLGVGMLALWQAYSAARSAKQAAERILEVKRDLAKRTLADELSNVRQLLAPAILLIKENAPRAASELISPSICTVVHLAARWKPVLSQTQTDGLSKAVAQLKSANKFLVAADLETESTQRCLTATENALHAVVEVQGSALAEADHLLEGNTK